MRVLVTGSNGFIGKNLVKYLQGRYELLAPKRNELNLLDVESVDAYLKKHLVDVVIHTAGKPGHRNAVDPTGIFYADTRMYFNLIRNRDYFDKLIITGSGAVYDIKKNIQKIKEDDWKINIPADEHGFFRYVTSHHIEASSGVVDLRLFGVFGKYEDYAIRFISNAICKVLFDLPITILKNRMFDYIYIDDLMTVVDYFINNQALYCSYNVTPDTAVDLYTIAEMVRVKSGKDLPIVVSESGMGLEYSGDNRRLRAEISELAFTPLVDAIEQLYIWYDSNIRQIDRSNLLEDK